MKKVIASALAGLIVAGCAFDTKTLTGANAAAGNVISFYTTSAQLREQLTLDTIKESAQLEYLSQSLKEPRTCRDNPGFRTNDLRVALNIKEQTIARLNQSDKDFKFLVGYSKAFDAIVKKSESARQDIENLAAITTSIIGLAPTPEAKAFVSIVNLLSEAAQLANEADKFAKLKQAARQYQPQLKRHARTISRSLIGMDRQTALDIAVWHDCVQEKYNLIWFLARNDRFSTSVIDVDNAYATFQTQYRAYVGSAPQIGSIVKDLLEANDDIVNARPNSEELRASIERYIKFYNDSRATLTAAAGLAGS